MTTENKTHENMTTQDYCDIFTHPADKRALEALKKIPMFDKLCSKFLSVFDEPFRKVNDMASKVQINERQLPKLHEMLLDICGKLKIEKPDFYLELNRTPNAYTYGDKSATVTLTSGLLECLTEAEIYAVIAHECGHIACKHVLYNTMANVLLIGGAVGSDLIIGDNFITAALIAPIKLALAHWHRCSELSADRAAAVCTGSAERVVGAMTRFAGGTASSDYQVDPEVFAEQAKDYKDLLDGSRVNKLIEYSLIYASSHPMPAVRASEIIEWCKSEEFEAVAFKPKAAEEPKPKRRGFFGLFRRRKD